MYPYGTTEAFPNMVDSDEHIISNSAHVYAECSNAGICDRSTGVCDCFAGFEGGACQRMSCPGTPDPCSGHGVCESLRNIASLYNSGSSYHLWDQHLQRGCVCDKGYHGPDCSLRYCPYAIDPYYYDDIQTVQYPFFFVAIMTTAPAYDISNGFAQPSPGYFRLQITDIYGATYFTLPIFAPASCEDLIAALEGIPGGVVPGNSLVCYHTVVNRTDPLIPNNPDFVVTYPSLYKFYFAGTMEYSVRNRPIDGSAGYASQNVPEIETDFIFAAIADQWGFLGAIVLLVLYGFLIYKMISIARTSKDIFGSVICVGIVSYFLFAIFQNIGMTIGLMPITGITLPLISCGGSSLLTTVISVGLVINIGMRRKKIFF